MPHELQSEIRPSLTRSPKMRTQNPAATHCVLVTTVCWYASSVTAAPTHPIRNPLRFRSMPPPLSLPAAALRLLARMRDKGWELGRGTKAAKSTVLVRMRGQERISLWLVPKARGAVFRLGKRRFVMPFCQQPLYDH
jgi:hypothetical protein